MARRLQSVSLEGCPAGATEIDRLRRAGLAWADSLLKALAASTTLHESILLHVLVSFAPGAQSTEELRPGLRLERRSELHGNPQTTPQGTALPLSAMRQKAL